MLSNGTTRIRAAGAAAVWARSGAAAARVEGLSRVAADPNAAAWRPRNAAMTTPWRHLATDVTPPPAPRPVSAARPPTSDTPDRRPRPGRRRRGPGRERRTARG